MDAQQNKQLVMDGYRLFQSGDIPGMMAYADDDAAWIGADAESVPFAGSFHGKAEVGRFFSELLKTMQPTRFVIKDVIAENDKVVVLGEATWLVRSTGRTYDSQWVHVFTMRDGKVTRFEAHADTAAGERAFRSDQPAQPSMTSQLHH